MKTIVINLFGGPGIGKSTLASELFTYYKKQGKEVELVREFAKELVWQGVELNKAIQPYLFGVQSKRELDLYGKVEYIITDSPLFLCHIYNNFDHLGNWLGDNRIYYDLLNDFLRANVNVKHLNFLLTREHLFNKNGRVHSENQSKLIDDLLAKELPHFLTITAHSKNAIEVITTRVGAFK